MHPQANIADSLRSPHSAQLGFVLASILSTLLMAGTEALIAVPAQAGMLENQDTRFEAAIATDLELPAFTVPEETDLETDANALQALKQASTVTLDLVQEAVAPEPLSQAASTNISESISESVPVTAADTVLPVVDAPDIAVDIFQPMTRAEATSTPEPPAIAQLDTQLAQQLEPLAENQSLGTPLVRVQAAYVLQDESSGRLRLSGTYAATPNLLFGTTLDLTAGENFADSEDVNFDLNELYFTLSPAAASNLRLTAGMIDLTSYFDRNSFAKDAVTQFFNPVFQTNPALAAAGIGSRPGALVNWDVTDNLNVKAAAFSSSRDLGDFAFDGFAGEVGLRLGNLIVRGTYASNRDAGQRDGFQEIFQFSRGNDTFGLRSDDREEALGINAEVFIPELNLGLFGRYGHYENLELDRGGNTYSFGINLLDLFMADDRLGLGYGRQLSNDDLRQDGDRLPDVLELFYDFRLSPTFRAGVTVQERDGFSDTVLGLRIRADFDVK